MCNQDKNNDLGILHQNTEVFFVVIPIQTISFYNPTWEFENYATVSCHTYPNDKLLQRGGANHLPCRYELSYLSKR